MKKWSTSTRVTVVLAVLLVVVLVYRSAMYNGLAKTISHEVATPRAVEAVRALVVRKKLARVFKDRTEQAKKQAIRTAQVFAGDMSMVEIEGHHLTMAEATSAALVEFLSDLELPVRAAAADALGRMGRPAARPLIDQALSSPDKDVRSNAARALQVLGDVAVPALVEAVKGGSPSQKVGAAGAVGKLRSARAIDALVGSLSAKEEEVRLACRDALVALKGPSVKPLIAALPNKDAWTRQHACEALGEIGDPQASVPLLKPLEDENRLVRLAATYALGKVKSKAGTAPLIAKLDDKDREIREAAAISLGQIGDAAAVTPLIAKLDDSVDKVREGAAAALGRLQPADAASLSAIERAANSTNDGTRAAAVFALGRIANPASVPAIAQRLQSDELPEVRERAARALGDMRSPAGIPALQAAFNDKEWRVNYAAQAALAAIGQPAVPALLTLLASDNALMARYGRKALVQMPKPPLADLTALALAATTPQAVRLNATIALGEVRSSDTLGVLEKLSQDRDPQVQEAAKQAMVVRSTPGAGETVAPTAAAPADGKDVKGKGGASAEKAPVAPAAPAAP